MGKFSEDDMPALEKPSKQEAGGPAGQPNPTARVASNFSKMKLERQDGTGRLYYENTYVFKATGCVVAVSDSTSEKYGPLDVQLDQTIFHPQGGGQPADTGTLTSGDNVYNVQFVAVTKDGIIHHYGNFTHGSFEPKTEVTQEIDAEKRELYARIPSAGHLIDLAAAQAGYGHLEPTKGYHFLDGSYVEYAGNIEAGERAAAKTKIQQALDQLIADDHKVTVANGDVRNVAYGEDP